MADRVITQPNNPTISSVGPLPKYNGPVAVSKPAKPAPVKVTLPAPKPKATVLPSRPSQDVLPVTTADGKPLKDQSYFGVPQYSDEEIAGTVIELGRKVKSQPDDVIGKIVKQTAPGIYDHMDDAQIGAMVKAAPDDEVGRIVKSTSGGAYDHYMEIADKLEQIDNSKNTFDRIKDSVKERLVNIGDSHRAKDLGQQSALETVLQDTGQVIGGAFDIAARGAIDTAKIFLPKSLEKGIEKATTSIAQKAVNTEAGKRIVKGVQTFTEEHPRAARNLSAIGNIAAVAPIGKAAQVTERALGKASLKVGEHLEKSVINKAANDALEIIRPILTKAEEQVAKEQGRATIKGVLRKVSVVPTSRELEIAEAAKDIVSKSKNTFQNIRSVKEEIAKTATKVSDALKKSDYVYKFEQVENALSKIEKPLLVSSDTTLNNAYNAVKEKMLDLAKKYPKTMSGLLDARKEFDEFIEKQFPDLYSSDKLTPMRQAIKDTRNTINDLIDSWLPEGSSFKADLRKQSLLYEAVENMAAKAPRLDTTITQRAMETIRKHPFMSSLGALGIGAGHAAILPLILNPATLTIIATYGSYKVGEKIITSEMVSKVLSTFLKTVGGALNKSEKQNIENLLKTFEEATRPERLRLPAPSTIQVPGPAGNVNGGQFRSNIQGTTPKPLLLPEPKIKYKSPDVINVKPIRLPGQKK